MALDQQLIGARSEPYEVVVERGQLTFFAKSTGERNPVFFDEAAAREVGHRAIPAPPTFAFTLSLSSPMTLESLGVDVSRILHGEQKFTHHAPIYAGDCLTLRDEVVDIYERKSGTLEFLLRRTEVRDREDRLCIEAHSTVVVRHG